MPWCVGVLIGISWASYQASNLIEQQSYLMDNQVILYGKVVSLPQEGSLTSFDFKVAQLCSGHHNCVKAHSKVKLYWRNPAFVINQGDELKLTAQMKRPYGHANPGGTHQAKSWFLNHISAQGSVKEIEVRHQASPSLRLKLKQFIDTALAGVETKGIFQALIIGVQDEVTQEQWAVFRGTGTSHLMAISGLHIGLVAGAIYWLMFKGWCRTRWAHRIPAQYPSAYLAIGGSLLYSHCAGWSIPTQRACLMIVVFMLSLILRRIISKRQVFCLSLIGVLVLDPFAPFKAGFWLSFTAVFLLLLGAWLNPDMKGFKRWFAPQGWLFLGLMPLTLLFFGQSSWSSVLANTLAIPWMSYLVVPLALLGAALSGCPTVGGLLLKLAQKLFEPLMDVLGYLSDSAMTFQTLIHMPGLVIAMMGVFIVMLPKGLIPRAWSVCCFIPLFMPIPNAVKAGEIRAHMMDVGQGTAVVLETERHLVIYDTGPKYESGFDAGLHVLNPFLRTLPSKPVAYVVISHADNDHQGGLASLAQFNALETVLTSDVKKVPLANNPCRKGQSWQLDGVRFDVLHPEDSLEKKTNNQSCVMMVTSGEHKLLLTGDIDVSVEHKLQSFYRDALQAHIVLVPHHGSLTSSSLSFIQQVNPKYAVMTVGRSNRYGHPKAEVVKRYQQQGATVLRTDDSGKITFHISPTAIETLPGWRSTLKGPWMALAPLR